MIDFTGREGGGLLTLKDIFEMYNLKSAAAVFKDYATSEKPLRIDRNTIQTFEMLEEIGEPAEVSNMILSDINNFAWTEIDGNFFVFLRKGYAVGMIRPTGDSDHYQVYLCRNEKDSMWHSLLTTATLDKDHALTWAIRLLKDYGDGVFAKQGMEWRDKPPSDAQLKMASNIYNKYRVLYRPVD